MLQVNQPPVYLVHLEPKFQVATRQMYFIVFKGNAFAETTTSKYLWHLLHNAIRLMYLVKFLEVSGTFVPVWAMFCGEHSFAIKSTKFRICDTLYGHLHVAKLLILLLSMLWQFVALLF